MKRKNFLGVVCILLILLSIQIPVFAKEKSKDVQQVVITATEYTYSRGQSGQKSVLPFLILKNENGDQIEASTSWEANGFEIDYQYEVPVGTYEYRLYSQKDGIDFGGGELYIGKNTSKIALRCIKMYWLVQSNFRDQMTAKVSHQDGRVFTPSNEDSYNFYLPCYDGDSYYNFELVPNDTENYVTQRGHFYNYTVGGAFKQLNLSDQHEYRLMKKHEFVAKVPKETEICHTSQSKFYMARDYENLEKLETESANDPNYDYYKTDYEGAFMLRQDGKVTRFCSFESEGKKSNFGSWSKDGDVDVFTFRELKDNSKQVIRNDTYGKANYFEANVMSNADMSRALNIEQGTYYDLAPLRTWQAVNTTGSNIYYDPEFHYTVLGDAVQVEVTDDDPIGQYGRIEAKQSGTSVVLYTYDAMEWVTELADLQDSNGFFLYSAMYPENTGTQIVQVGKTDSGINLNVDLDDLDTVYWLNSQTDETGKKTEKDDHAVYTFKPESSYGDVLSVRVHDPYQIENGVLNISDESNWLDDSKYWTNYQANEDGTFTINLKRGRNIVEVSSAHGTEYCVITAKPLDITVSNKTNPGKKLVSGDTAKLHIDGLCTALYKLGAIYNPATQNAMYTLNGTDTVKFAANQYKISTTSDKEIYLDEDGEYKFSSGYIAFDAYTGQEKALGKAHRDMSRSSLHKSNYTGGLSELRPGKRCILPDFSFEVEDGVNKAEDDARRTGTLSSLKVINGSKWTPKIQTNTGFSGTGKTSQKVTVQAIASDKNAKIYVRTWKCGDSTKSSFIEVPNGTKSDILGTYDFSQENPMWVEVLVKPTTGYPKVYATEIYAASNTISRKLLTGIYDVTVTEADSNENFERYDGVLECVNADCELNGEKPTNLYGFVGTQTDYVTSVPYETEKIDLNVFQNATKKYTATTIKTKGISLKSVDSDGNETDIAYGEPISLNVGENKFVITQTCKGTKETVTYTYHLTVTRRPQARTITFKVPEDATVLVTNEKDVVQKPLEDGSYKCENGTYTWHVSKDGYLTTSGSFTVTDDSESQIITVEDLEAVPEQSGNVSVRIAGQNAVLRPTADVKIPKEIEDLKAHRYVKYNYGGYTALHALLDACDENGISFKCSKGKLTVDDTSASGTKGSNAGWICEINGVVCKDPANTLVNGGDKVEFYYNADLQGMLHAWMTPENKDVDRGTEITLMVLGKDPSGEKKEYSTVANAKIYDGNKCIGTTDEFGQAIINTNTLTLGTHYLTAVLKNEDGQNLLTAVMSTITVHKVDDPSAEPGKTVVSFRLIGDTKHGDDTADETKHSYTTWIATDTYTFEGDEVTVGDVFKKALDEAGLSYEGLEKNYISAITAPKSCGGYELREKDNGQNSGWMYTVNGVHPSMDLNSWYVSNGDEIIWHYIDDYKVEQSDMKNDDGTYGSAGNASTWNKWLEAADETPGAREKAAEVTDKINQIGVTIELTDECEAKITAAREAYEELSREEKGYVTNYDALTAAEEELARLKKEADDKAAATKVTDLIEALPAVKDLTLEDQEDVVAARTAYGNLTDDQKDYVTTETYGTLVLAEEQIAKLLDAAAVDELIKEIEALPDAENVTLENETAIANALAHYNALSEEQQADLEEKSPDSLTKLNAVIDRLNVLKEEAADQKAVDEVNEKLNALPAAEDILFADETAVTEARNAFEALDEIKEGLKDRVSVEALAKLTAAEDRLDALQEGVDHVAELIEALPAVDDLTVADADQVQEARDAYNALNNDQKQQLTESGLLSDLLVAENQIAWLQKDAEAAKKVTDRINSLPAVKDLRLSDKTTVEAARYAYDNLSDEQKQYVSEDTLKALEEREAEIKRLEEVTPNPTPTPDPNPSDDPKQDEDEDSVTLTYQNYPISVTGKLSGYELRLTALKADDDVVKQMQNMISSKEALIRLYDVALYKDGKEVEWNDKLTVNFQVGTSYNGQTLSVLHEVNGKIETLSGTVSNGILSVAASGTGSFGVVVPASTVSTGSSTNGGSAGTVTNGNLGGGSTGTGNGTTAVSGTGKVTSAKTGDDTDIFFPIAGLITASGVLAGIVLYYKKKKRITGVTEEE